LEYRDLLLHRRNFTLVSVNVAAAGRAAALRARYGIMTPDAIVVATALEMQCQVLLTNDLRLRRVAELRVLVLDDFLV
jgi:predicted nucleic acid-binding protein